jgi:hypothetical protein
MQTIKNDCCTISQKEVSTRHMPTCTLKSALGHFNAELTLLMSGPYLLYFVSSKTGFLGRINFLKVLPLDNIISQKAVIHMAKKNTLHIVFHVTKLANKEVQQSWGVNVHM